MWRIEFIRTECIVVYNVLNETNYKILHLVKSSIVYFILQSLKILIL